LARLHDLCEHHAAGLLAVASLMLYDPDAARQTVVDTVAAAALARTGPNIASIEMRSQLAGSVYRRCLERLILHERFPDTEMGISASEPVGVLARLSFRHRATVGLVLLGGQSLGAAASTMGVSPQIVIADLTSAIASIRALQASRQTGRHPLRRPTLRSASPVDLVEVGEVA